MPRHHPKAKPTRDMLTNGTWCSKAAAAARTSSGKASSEASATCKSIRDFRAALRAKVREQNLGSFRLSDRNLHIALDTQLPQLVHNIGANLSTEVR